MFPLTQAARIPGRPEYLLLACLIFLTRSGVTCGSDVQVNVGISDHQRMQRGKWGLMQAAFANSSDTDREVLVVVVPPSSRGLQYGRQVVIPAGCHRTCQWPVLMTDSDAPVFNFEYLVFEDPGGSGEIQRVSDEEVVRSFTVINPESRNGTAVGYRGLLTSFNESPRDRHGLETLANVLRNEAGQERMELTISAKDLDGYPEALESLDQLLITSQTLHDFPEACDAVRVWVQRGGRMWLFLDQTGMKTAHALLADTLPLTRIDETSTNVVKMKINKSESKQRYPERELTREFSEPVRQVRVIAGSGRTLWSVGDWPAVIEVPFGNGTVFVTTISPEAFVQMDGDQRSLPCARQIADRMFRDLKKDSPVSEQRLSSAAAGSIGYEVPSRAFAATVMLGFVALLTVAGTAAIWKSRPAWLLWAIPLLALFCTVPAVRVGARSRNVAPSTAIQQLFTSVVEGQTTLAADGVMSVYHPTPSAVHAKMKDFALLVPEHTNSENYYRRMVWTDRGESEWRNLRQAVGVRNYHIRSMKRLDQPPMLKMTLDQDGLSGQIDHSDALSASDMILAGLSPDRMSAHMQADRNFRVSPGNALAATEFVTGTILTDTQKRRASVYKDLFRTADRTTYPDRLSLLYWSDLVNPSIRLGEEVTRRNGSVLVALPVDLQPPAVNTDFTIPAALLPYQTVFDDQGGLSRAYSNPHREWRQREVAGVTLLEFKVPEVCRPFHATGGTLVIRLNAGSRSVILSMGSRDHPALIRTFNSPAGLYPLALSPDHLNSIVKTGSVYLRMDVSETDSSDSFESTRDRDDYWKVDRMMLTLNGVRKE